MRIEFQLTAEEFITAQISHAANSPRSRGRGGVVGTLIYIAGWIGYVLLAYLYFPWFEPNRPINALMACIVVPMLPWVLIIVRTVVLVFGRRPLRAPWKVGNRIASRRASFWKSLIPIVPSLVGLTFSFTVIALKFRSLQHPDQFPNIEPGLLVVCVLPLPMWVCGLAILLITRMSRRANAWRAWEQQTHLHNANVVEIDVERVVIDSEQSHIEYRWTAFVGSLETPSQFLLYISAAAFHILPKRAFEPKENVEAMHHLLEAKLAKPIAAFPVQNVTSKPPVSNRVAATALPLFRRHG